MGDTESGHCQGACCSQWFFYVPLGLQVSETAPPSYVVMQATRDTQSPMLKGEKEISTGLSRAHRGLNLGPPNDRRTHYHLRYCNPPLTLYMWCSVRRDLLNFSVPQGSVLGLILFSLYVSPVTRISRQHGLLAYFLTDDSQLYVTFRPLVRGDETDIAGRAEACVGNIRWWMLAQLMKLNATKTEYFILCP